MNIEEVEKELVRLRQFVSDLVQDFQAVLGEQPRNDFSQRENQERSKQQKGKPIMSSRYIHCYKERSRTCRQSTN
jgi:hypothetical protein